MTEAVESVRAGSLIPGDVWYYQGQPLQVRETGRRTMDSRDVIVLAHTDGPTIHRWARSLVVRRLR